MALISDSVRRKGFKILRHLLITDGIAIFDGHVLNTSRNVVCVWVGLIVRHFGDWFDCEVEMV